MCTIGAVPADACPSRALEESSLGTVQVVGNGGNREGEQKGRIVETDEEMQRDAQFAYSGGDLSIWARGVPLADFENSDGTMGGMTGGVVSGTVGDLILARGGELGQGWSQRTQGWSYTHQGSSR